MKLTLSKRWCPMNDSDPKVGDTYTLPSAKSYPLGEMILLTKMSEAPILTVVPFGKDTIDGKKSASTTWKMILVRSVDFDWVVLEVIDKRNPLTI